MTAEKKSDRRDVIRAFGYVARPKRTETRDGIEQGYWTVRCRRKGEEGEWTLGWFSARRAAESALNDWVAKHQVLSVKAGGEGLVVEVLDKYVSAVETMTALRPNTLSNREYTASQLREFVEKTSPEMKMAHFDVEAFSRFKQWMEGKFSPQTTLNGVVGARTFLRWAVSSGYVKEAPKAPSVHVPRGQREPLFQEDIEAVIKVAKPPLDLLLRLLWETGLRIAEATSRRGCDIERNGKHWVVRIEKSDEFVPKTSHSARLVPLSPELADALIEQAKNPNDLIFACGHTRYWYQHWRQLLVKAQKKAEVAPFNFHGIRRAVADRLRRSGVPIDVYIAMMGHAAITGLRHYSTVSMDDMGAALAKGMAGARRRDP